MFLVCKKPELKMIKAVADHKRRVVNVGGAGLNLIFADAEI